MKLTISQILTPDEIRAAVDIWEHDRANFHKRVQTEIVEPALPRINTVLGQENHAGFIAYAIEYVFGESTV